MVVVVSPLLMAIGEGEARERIAFSNAISCSIDSNVGSPVESIDGVTSLTISLQRLSASNPGNTTK